MALLTHVCKQKEHSRCSGICLNPWPNDIKGPCLCKCHLKEEK